MLEDNISDISQRGKIWSKPKGCEELSLPPSAKDLGSSLFLEFFSTDYFLDLYLGLCCSLPKMLTNISAAFGIQSDLCMFLWLFLQKSLNSTQLLL